MKKTRKNAEIIDFIEKQDYVCTRSVVADAIFFNKLMRLYYGGKKFDRQKTRGAGSGA